MAYYRRKCGWVAHVSAHSAVYWTLCAGLVAPRGVNAASIYVDDFSGDAERGRFVMEAETFTTRRPGSDAAWSEVNGADGTILEGPDIGQLAPTWHEGARGNFLEVIGVHRGMAEPPTAAEYEGPSVDYSVRLETPGSYRLFARWLGRHEGTDSLYAYLLKPDGSVLTDAGPEYFAFHQYRSDWIWDNRGVANSPGVAGAGFPHEALWTISQPGDYTIRIAKREPETALDAIVFQTTNLAAPDGMGPAVSRLVRTSESQTLSSLIENDGTIFSGDTVFSDFSYDASGEMPNADRVTVIAAHDGETHPGIRLQGAFLDLFGDSGSDAVITYKMTSPTTRKMIGSHLQANVAIVGPAGAEEGFVGVTATFFPEDEDTLLSVFDVEPGPHVRMDWRRFREPHQTLSVQIGISAFAAAEGSTATATFIDQSFVPVPEPAAAVLLAVGALAMTVIGRVRRHSRISRRPSMVRHRRNPGKQKQMKARVKVWLEIDGQYVFGYGVSEMLKAVESTGSIKAAAESVGKSYRYVWSRIKNAERDLDEPLVQTQVGGRGVRRSSLTELASQLVADYDALRRRTFEVVEKEFSSRF